MNLIVRQISGLGNQMFQYAAGRYYSRQLDARMSLAFDPPHKAHSYGHPRPFLLSHFAIEAPCRELNRFERVLLLANELTNGRRLRSLRPLFEATLRQVLKVRLVAEATAESFRFQPELPPGPPAQTIILLGYWQVHQIPGTMSDDLRREFSLRSEATGKNREILRRIQGSENAISVHFRRGDYALQAEGNCVLPLSYYNSAIAQLRRHLRNPTFFVFSDDINFARSNLERDIPAVFVDHNDASSAHEDLRLMSSCRHHIIANSTFSWWAAWLAAGVDKIVIAPRNWMVMQRPTYDDLFPPDWRLLG